VSPVRRVAELGSLDHSARHDTKPEYERIDTMNKMFDYIVAHSDWLLPFAPILCVVVWFAIDSRWSAYSRRKNYQELKILNELREKSIITQEEFDEKKQELLSA
jgi:hypothetical protein